MASMSRLTELTEIIASETKKVQEYFAANRLRELSFDPSAATDFPVHSTNTEIQDARRAVVNATQELHDLMVGPRETVRWAAWSVCVLILILAVSLYIFLHVHIQLPIEVEAACLFVSLFALGSTTTISVSSPSITSTSPKLCRSREMCRTLRSREPWDWTKPMLAA